MSTRRRSSGSWSVDYYRNGRVSESSQTLGKTSTIAAKKVLMNMKDYGFDEAVMRRGPVTITLPGTSRRNPGRRKSAIGKRFDDCVRRVSRQPARRLSAAQARRIGSTAARGERGRSRYGKAAATRICAATFHRSYGKKFSRLSGLARRRNPVSGPVDRTAAHELLLYGQNDGTLYHRMEQPIEKNLARKILKGTYNSTMALKAWQYWADEAAKMYVKEFGGPHYSQQFNANTRREAAKEMRDSFEGEVDAQDGPEGFLR